MHEARLRAVQALHAQRGAHRERAALAAGTRALARNLAHELRRVDEQVCPDLAI